MTWQRCQELGALITAAKLTPWQYDPAIVPAAIQLYGRIEHALTPAEKAAARCACEAVTDWVCREGDAR